MKWIEVSIRKPIAVNGMIFLSLFLLGLFSLFDMKTELLPNMEYPVVKLQHWPGASAQDVEKQISNKIEKVLPNIGESRIFLPVPAMKIL